jgi:hypothetical protein
VLTTVLPYITEIFPKPSDGLEWIELYNPAVTSFSLESWTLWDQLSQPSLLYTFGDFSLAPNSTVLVEVTKKLNDSGDGVILYNEIGEPISSIVYTNAKTDLGYTLVGENIYEWQTPSPNFFIIPPVASPTITIQTTPTPTNLNTPTQTENQSQPTTIFSSPTPKLSATVTTLKQPTPTKNHTQPPTPTASLQSEFSQFINKNETVVSETTTNLANRINLIIKTQPTPNLGKRASPSAETNRQQLQTQAVATASTNKLYFSRSKLVFFSKKQNPWAPVNVIIGGLIIASYYGWIVWHYWKSQQLLF